MSKRTSLGSQFQKLDGLRTIPSSQSVMAKTSPDAKGRPSERAAVAEAVVGSADSRSSILEETLSTADTVTAEHCPNLTVSSLDGVQHGQSQSQPASSADTVQPEPCQKRTASNLDTVAAEDEPSEVMRPSSHFTAVPHDLLRGEAKFRDPLDFMVYLHLYSYSYGFGRPTASMGQAQLERFTGAAKNTIKRALDRLKADGWVKIVEEYEHSRMSRKWRVYSPEDRRGPRPAGRGSKADSVRAEQCPERTGGLSNSDPVTVAKMDTYKERGLKEKSEKTLSLAQIRERDGRARELPEGLGAYLNELKPERKRRAEMAAFGELVPDYLPSDVAVAVAWLIENGLPGSGEPCHSPLAFLASGGIGAVLALFSAAREKREKAEDYARQVAEMARRRIEDEKQEVQDVADREAAFKREFPTPASEDEVFRRYGSIFPMLGRNGPALRNLVISAWWSEKRQTRAATWGPGLQNGELTAPMVSMG